MFHDRCYLLLVVSLLISQSVKALTPETFPIMANVLNPCKVMWTGPMFGRLTKSGRKYLKERGGWEELDKQVEDSQLLQFIWPNKSGPQFAMDMLFPASIRPYPKDVTDTLDDKKSLARIMEGTNILPDHISTMSNCDENDSCLYFVKHRYGAQGKSVYPYRYQELQDWFTRSKNIADFVIQKEVSPALDPEGRKFVLRGHVLVWQQAGGRLNRLLHEDIICLAHAARYQQESKQKSVHVSQSGRKHPQPSLLNELPPTHPAFGKFETIKHVLKIMLDCTPFPTPNTDGLVCFALLGVDCLLDSDQTVKVCEVNSHPALGWGSMSGVPKHVFPKLIQDTLGIVVFKDTPDTTGFSRF